MRTWLAFRILAVSEHLRSAADGLHSLFVNMISCPYSPSGSNRRSLTTPCERRPLSHMEN
jgi:hypothetical protein